jgi:signal transduction histidine kinase
VTQRTAARLAWGILAFIAVSAVVSITLSIAGQRYDVFFVAVLAIFPVVGVVLASRRPSNPLGWIMLGIGVVWALPSASYGVYGLTEGRHLPGAAYALALDGPMWVWFIGGSGFLLLLFPDGHLPTRSWRWFAWTMGAGMAMFTLFFVVLPGNLSDYDLPHVRNPMGIEALRPFESLIPALVLMVPLTVVGGAVAVIRRLRRANDDVERHQLRWLAWASGVVAVSFVLAFSTGWADETAIWGAVLQFLSVWSFGLIPVAIGVAVLRYRLYDIDVVIRKTVVVGVLGAFIALVYVAIVAGAGAVVGARGNALASALAAAVVAIAFQPVAGRARRLADRVVYGRRASPYEALSAFSERVGETYATEDLLPRMARILGEATGARRADVWLKVGERFRPAASWPADAGLLPDRSSPDGDLPGLPEADASFPVRHQGELLGALALAKPVSDPLSTTDERLASDLAGQAGLVLSNARLTTELESRIDELHELHKRLVSAQDRERRRLERNIHDGAQQQLVALSVKLRLAQSLVAKDPDQTGRILEQLQTETTETLEDLRDLARGIYPPLLADKGLVAALESQTRRSVVPVEVHPDGTGRYPQEVEAAVYFSVLEALQNVAKYAHASRAGVRLLASDSVLVFEVDDDGVGFDPASTGYGTGLQGIADRLAALDGRIEIRSGPGGGTVVTGTIPLGSDPARDGLPTPSVERDETR